MTTGKTIALTRWTFVGKKCLYFLICYLEKEMATHSSVFCLENPKDGGACWAAVYEIAQSQTRLK